jgi:hypothetical protein
MNLSDKLMSQDILHDDKARRVLNTAPDKTPNIDIQSLINGITIEELDAINVPVLRYTTQITIHGIFPQNAAKYLLTQGLVLNQNRSLGVRYNNIDMTKKKLLRNISNLSEDENKWTVVINSTETHVYKVFYSREGTTLPELKKQAIDCYNNTDDSLYIGFKEVFGLMYGMGYAVLITLGAIYQKDVWKFSKRYFNLDEVEYDIRVSEEEITREYRHKLYEEERAKKLAEEKVLYDANLKELESKHLKLMTQPKVGYYISLFRDGMFTVHYIKSIGKQQATIYERGYDSITDCKAFNPKHGGTHIDIDKLKKKVWYCLEEPKAITQADKPKHEIKETINTDGYTITYEGDWTWIKFTTKPSQPVLDTLRSMGGRFSAKRMAWYFTQHITSIEL